MTILQLLSLAYLCGHVRALCSSDLHILHLDGARFLGLEGPTSTHPAAHFQCLVQVASPLQL